MSQSGFWDRTYTTLRGDQEAFAQKGLKDGGGPGDNDDEKPLPPSSVREEGEGSAAGFSQEQ